MADVIHDSNTGTPVPWLVKDIESQAITSAFAPTTDKYLKAGFLVMPAADITLEVITWHQYQLHGNSTTGLTPVSVFCAAGSFLPCRIVYIGAESGVTVNLGII